MAEAPPGSPGAPAPGSGELSDEQALAAYLCGDERLVAELVRRYERPLYGFLCRLTGRPADAADLFQETFLRVVRHADSFAGQSRFKTWLYAVALNAWRMHARTSARRPVQPLTEAVAPADGKSGPVDAAGHGEIGARIAEAVRRLPDVQREVFILRVYNQMNYREIAQALDRPLGTVKSQMRLALVKMRTVLHDVGEAYGVT
jgi:RNA polymerase sigma-70 factor (ECF subfamily)